VTAQDYADLLARLRADLAVADHDHDHDHDSDKLYRAALERAEVAEARARALHVALVDVLALIDAAQYLTHKQQQALRRAREVLAEMGQR